MKSIQKGIELAEQGEFERARGHFMALAGQPERAQQANLWLARLAFAEGDSDSALNHIEEAEKVNSKNDEALALKGLYYLQEEQFEQALPILESVRKSSPELAFNYTNLSTCYRELERIPDAIEAGRKAVQLSPKDPAAHFALSQALAENGELEEAVNEALLTLQLNPGHLMAYVFLGSLFRQIGDLDAVIELYKEALTHVPEATPLREELLELLFNKEDFGSALEQASQLAEERGSEKDFFYLAQCAARMNQDSLAEDAFLHVIEMDPQNWRPHFLLGELYANHGLGEEAVNGYAAAVERDPENAELRNVLGLTLVRVGRAEEAEPHLLKAIRLSSGMIEAVLNLGICYGNQKKWKLAKDQANIVIQKSEADSELRAEAERLLKAVADADKSK